MGRLGVVHLFVVSGLNVGLLLIALLRLFRPLGAAGQAIALAGVWAYVGVAGASTSAVRAGLMITYACFLKRTGTRGRLLNHLGIVGIVLLAANPAAHGGPGLQFSFLSLLSLGLGSEVVSQLQSALTRGTRIWENHIDPGGRPGQIETRRLRFLLESWLEPVRCDGVSAFFHSLGRPLGFVAGLILVSLLVQIATLPLSLYYSNVWSWSQWLANLFLIPIFGLLVPAGFLLLATFWTPLAFLAAAVDEGFNRFAGPLKAAGWLPQTFVQTESPFPPTAANRLTSPVAVQSDAPGPSGEDATDRFFLALPANTSVIPHAAFGEVGSLSITSQVIVGNPHLESVDGVVHFIDTTTGLPIAATVDGETSAQHPFSLGSLESRVFEINPAGVDPIQIAWVAVKGRKQLTAAANFVTFDRSAGTAEGPQGVVTGTILAEAGIGASRLGFRHVLNVRRDGVSDTAFAVLNATSGPAEIRLRDTAGQVVASETLMLAPRQQQPRFFGEFFNLPAGDFGGTVDITSNASLALISLKTINGLQSSSLPSGTP